MTDDAQRTTWLAWESHNAYCGTPTPFAVPGLPAR